MAKVTNKKVAPAVDPLVASLMPESDKKMGAIAGISLVVAIALCIWASMYEAVVDEIVYEESNDNDLTASMMMEETKEEKKEEEKKEEKKKEEKKKDKKDKSPEAKMNKRNAGSGGPPRGKGNPNARPTRGFLKEITALSTKSTASAFSAFRDKAANHTNQLDKLNGFTKTGKSQFGERRGKANGGFNEGFGAGGSGIGGLLDGFGGGGGGRGGRSAIGGKGTKGGAGAVKAPSDRDISMGGGDGSRSKADIMKVVKQRTPGLRHIYNKSLKTKPGFAGKVTLRFTIAPAGDIISISIASSTTGYAEFDNQIKAAVAKWNFGPVKSGNTTVTLPFNFAE